MTVRTAWGLAGVAFAASLGASHMLPSHRLAFRAVAVASCVVLTVWIRRQEPAGGCARPPPVQQTRALPWVGLVAVFTWDYWFPSVYRGIPFVFWIALVAVGAFFGMRRWVAFVAERRDRLQIAISLSLFTAGLTLFNLWEGSRPDWLNGVVAALCLLTAGLAYLRLRREPV